MEIDRSRIIRPRDFDDGDRRIVAPRRHAHVLAAVAAGIAGVAPATPLVGQRLRRRGPVVGCSGGMCGDCAACDALDAARYNAERCYPGVQRPRDMQNNLRNNGMGVDPSILTPDNCHRYGLRYVPVGVNSGAILINTSSSLTITLATNFLPYLHTVTPSTAAPNINMTAINYSIQPMLIGGIVNGEQFSILNNQGGYRLPTKRWLGTGDVITYTFTTLAAVAANGLQIQAYGFTDAPG